MRIRRKRGLKGKAAMVERLERRQLLSVAFNSTGDILRIYGGPAADNIGISTSGDKLVVNENGTIGVFALSPIKRIYFNGLGGSDRIELPATLNLPLNFLGGDGNDTAIGGMAADTLSGEGGDDLLIGNKGFDLIYAGAGNDRALGNNGWDTIFGGDGNDIINGGPGTNVITDTQGTNAINTGAAAMATHDIKATYQPLAYLSNVAGYDPGQVRRAYNFVSLDTATAVEKGSGQTIYIVLAFSAQDLVDDVAHFSDQFDLPLPSTASAAWAASKTANGTFSLSIVNASGHKPAVDADSAGELDLDVEWAHSMAPMANIVVVQADSWLTYDINAAVKLAASMSESNGGGVVSMSFKINPADDVPPLGFQAIDSIFAASTQTTFIAASGDVGGSLNYPASSPYVTSVGGTTLPLDQDGNQNGEETGWDGSGGGETVIYTAPGYQSGISFPTTTGQFLLVGRGIPDVAYNADPNTGFATYVGTPQARNTGWFTIGGTSAGAPQWAALVALMNARRAQLGKTVIGSKLNGVLYEAYNNGDYDVANPAIRDVLIGTAGTNICGTGYDLVTGLGTPDAQLLIDKVANFVPFYFQQTFTFSDKLYMPYLVDQSENYASQPLAARPRSGYGLMSGAGDVLVDFQHTNTDWYSDPLGLARTDRYTDVDTSSTVLSPVQLYRTNDGRIYGDGYAIMASVDPGITTLNIDFYLRFEGNWWLGTDGQTHFHVNYYAADRITGQQLPKDAQFRVLSVEVIIPGTGGIDAGPFGAYMEGFLDG